MGEVGVGGGGEGDGGDVGDVGDVGRVGEAERRTAAAPPLGTRPQWSVEKGRERYCVGMLSWGWAKMPRASKAV